MSGPLADSAGLMQERSADDVSIGSGLVFHEMIGVLGNWKACVKANLAELAVCRSHRAVGKATKSGSIVGGSSNSGRHFEVGRSCCISDVRETVVCLV